MLQKFRIEKKNVHLQKSVVPLPTSFNKIDGSACDFPDN